MSRRTPKRSTYAALIAGLLIGSALSPLAAPGEPPLASALAASAADQTSSSASPRTAEQLEKTVRELQAEWITTRAAVEQLHRATESEARHQAEQLSQQLTKLEKDLETQKQEKEQVLKMVEAANQQTLIYAVLFIGIALIAILVISLFQIKATTKLTALAVNYADRLNLQPPASVPNQIASTAESEHLLRSLDRLQQRIEELETSASRNLLGPPEKSAPTRTLPEVSSYTAAGNPQPKPESGKVLVSTSALGVSSPPSNGHSHEETRAILPEEGRSDPQSMISGILGKGESLLKMGQAKSALIAFEEALRIDSRHVEAWVKKGSALEKLDRMEEALSCYDRAIALDRTSTLAYLYKGGVCNRLERFDEALACYEQALKSHDHDGAQGSPQI
jgi:tetratricopeptide (TPR) repeat protein